MSFIRAVHLSRLQARVFERGESASLMPSKSGAPRNGRALRPKRVTIFEKTTELAPQFYSAELCPVHDSPFFVGICRASFLLFESQIKQEVVRSAADHSDCNHLRSGLDPT